MIFHVPRSINKQCSTVLISLIKPHLILGKVTFQKVCQPEAPIKQGLQSIQNLAQKGYIPALMAVGNMFVNGNIVPQNLPEAKKIFASLAQENVPQAQESLAVVEKMMADQSKASNKATAKKS